MTWRKLAYESTGVASRRRDGASVRVAPTAEFSSPQVVSRSTDARLGDADDQSPRAGAARNDWSKQRIRAARRVVLAPLLRRRGYPLRELPDRNYLVEDHPGLVVKDHYWIWTSRSLKGNAIDFLMLVECRSFQQAMEILADWIDPAAQMELDGTTD
jgi:hypothetical protein